MTVNVTKPALNIREKLAELDKRIASDRLDATLRKMEIENDVHTLGDIGLGERAAKFLRPDADKR